MNWAPLVYYLLRQHTPLNRTKSSCTQSYTHKHTHTHTHTHTHSHTLHLSYLSHYPPLFLSLYPSHGFGHRIIIYSFLSDTLSFLHNHRKHQGSLGKCDVSQ